MLYPNAVQRDYLPYVTFGGSKTGDSAYANQGNAGAGPLEHALSLSPGLLKDQAARSNQLRALSARGDVRLVLDLPGQVTQVVCSAQVSVASPDGAWERVWSTSQPVWSTPSQGGQQLALIFDASLLGCGDYLVEVAGTDKQVRETYSFRVSPM